MTWAPNFQFWEPEGLPKIFLRQQPWLVLHLWLIFITFMVGITFMVFITFMGDTEATKARHSTSLLHKTIHSLTRVRVYCNPSRACMS